MRIWVGSGKTAAQAILRKLEADATVGDLSNGGRDAEVKEGVG